MYIGYCRRFARSYTTPSVYIVYFSVSHRIAIRTHMNQIHIMGRAERKCSSPPTNDLLQGIPFWHTEIISVCSVRVHLYVCESVKKNYNRNNKGQGNWIWRKKEKNETIQNEPIFKFSNFVSSFSFPFSGFLFFLFFISLIPFCLTRTPFVCNTTTYNTFARREKRAMVRGHKHTHKKEKYIVYNVFYVIDNGSNLTDKSFYLKMHYMSFLSLFRRCCRCFSFIPVH